MSHPLSKRIDIIVACHGESYVPTCPLFVPVQTGAAQAAQHFAGMQRDDEGDNISDRNDRYCELTAQYWAWKNLDADHYGMFHNRRYLSFSETKYEKDGMGWMHFSAPDDAALEALGIDEAVMRRVIEDADLVIPERMHLEPPADETQAYTVERQYARGFQHDPEDLRTAVRTLVRRHPDYEQDAKEYLASCSGWFCNIFIMTRELFFDYCAWLFPLLDEIDRQIDVTDASEYRMRTTGFLAERLEGIYLTHLLRTRPDLRVKELPVAFFESVEDPYPQPAFGAQSVPVVMASSDEYAPIASVLLESLRANMDPQRKYDVIVLDAGIRPEYRAVLRRAARGADNFSVRFVPICGRLKRYSLSVKLHLSDVTYARLLVPDYLRSYDKVVYLDTDTVLCTDVARLYDEDLGGCVFGAVRDTISAGWCNTAGHGMRPYVCDELGLKSPFDYFNGGVLVMDLAQLRREYSTESLLELACSREWMWMDQDVLNKIGANRTKLLDQGWNVMAHAGPNVAQRPEKAAPMWLQRQFAQAFAAPRLIHWAGHALPCFDPDADLAVTFWRYARHSELYERILDIMACGRVHAGGEKVEARVEERRQEGIRYTLNTVYSWRFTAKLKRLLRRK